MVKISVTSVTGVVVTKVTGFYDIPMCVVADVFANLSFSEVFSSPLFFAFFSSDLYPCFCTEIEWKYVLQRK